MQCWNPSLVDGGVDANDDTKGNGVDVVVVDWDTEVDATVDTNGSEV